MNEYAQALCWDGVCAPLPPVSPVGDSVPVERDKVAA